MPTTVLAASSSEYRRWWYRHHLTREGYVVRVADDATDCLSQLRLEMPDVLILETPLLWGGADGVLDVLATEEPRGETRVVLVTVTNAAGEIYRVSRFTVDDVLSRAELESRLLDRLYRLSADGAQAVLSDSRWG